MSHVAPKPPALPDWEEWTTSGAWASSDTRSLPLTPGLLGDVLWLIRDPEVDASRLIKFIAKDQSLAARVLRLANVAAYAPMVEVTSIGLAVTRLGTDAVRRALLAVCFASWANPLRGSASGHTVDIAHSVAVASLARHIATAVGTDRDEAFTQGLLHDIGKLFMLKLQGEYEKKGGTLPSAEILKQVEEARHGEIGEMAMQLWGLPLALREPIRWHHEPLAAPTYPRESAIVYVANELSHRYAQQGERELAFASDPAMMGLGLTEAWLAQTDAQASKLLEGADLFAA